MSKTVSVIIPCYNGAAYIDRSIQSVYDQDYPYIELIVVDDGSQDNSRAIIFQWKAALHEKGIKFRYVYQENRGAGGAIDTGLKYVSGAYLTLLDADDIFLQGSISKRATWLDQHPDYSMVRSNGWYVWENKRELFVQSQAEKNSTDVFTDITYGRTNNWAGTYMLRTEILFETYKDRKIYPSRYGQNFQLILPVAYKRKSGFLDEPLMEYIQQDNSFTRAEIGTFERDEQNANGFKDIYFHVIDAVVHDESEKKQYQAIYENQFCRGAMQRAIHWDRHDEAKLNFKRLCESGLATMEDKITYYNYFCRPVAYGFRIKRKLKSLATQCFGHVRK